MLADQVAVSYHTHHVINHQALNRVNIYFSPTLVNQLCNVWTVTFVQNHKIRMNKQSCTIIKYLVLKCSFNVSHNTNVWFSWYYKPTLPFSVAIFVFYASPFLFLFMCYVSTLALHHISPSIISSFTVLAPCSDCIWHDLCNEFTVLNALRVITGLSAEFPANSRVNVVFLFPLLLVYRFTIAWLSACLCSFKHYVVSGTTPPLAALHCKQVVLICSSHSFMLSLLKSRSALLFINCRFTTPLVFQL